MYKKGEVHVFIREFWKSFSDFISEFIIVGESFYKGFLKRFSSKYFQSFGIESSIIFKCSNFVILYIYYGWQLENLVSFKITVILPEIFLGGMMLKVQSCV